MSDGVRRKNATRESTNTLKAWLQEHKKNPYPTKGEKIMLAIITKMTLTQVKLKKSQNRTTISTVFSGHSNYEILGINMVRKCAETSQKRK